jgi:hypothetical protein
MKQKAEKHLEIALGGNMNISTLTPLALIEIMTDFAKKQVEAINYTRCCESDSEQLIAFSDWVFDQPLHLGGNERKLVKQYLEGN